MILKNVSLQLKHYNILTLKTIGNLKIHSSYLKHKIEYIFKKKNFLLFII